MATRFYISGVSPGFTPTTTRGTWTYTQTTLYTYRLGPKGGSAATIASNGHAVAGTWTHFTQRWVSEPLTADYTFTSGSETLSWCIGNRVSNTSNTQGNVAIAIYITQGDTDSMRGSILRSTYVGGDNFTTTATGWADSGVALSNTVSASKGDRIVVELGWQKSGTSASTRTATTNYSNEGSTDLSGDSDTNVTTRPGWIEFSGTFTTAPQTSVSSKTIIRDAIAIMLALSISVSDGVKARDTGSAISPLKIPGVKTLIANYPTSYHEDYGLELNNESGYDRAFAQSFKPVGSYSVTSVEFYLKKMLDPSGNIYAKLYTASGTYGSTNKPNVLLGTSDPVSATELSTSYGLIPFTFSTPIPILSDQVYMVSCEYNNTTPSIYFSFDAVDPVHPGNSAYYDTGVGGWLNFGTDGIFYLYGDPLVIDNVITKDYPSISISTGSLSINVYDEVKVRENNVNIMSSLVLSSYDPIKVRDYPTPIIPWLLTSVFDRVSGSDPPVVILRNLNISVYDPIKSRDQATSFLPHLPISSSDKVITRDQGNVVLPLFVNTNDKVITKDIPQVSTGTLSINTFDPIKTRDSISPLINPLRIPVNDKVISRDTPSVSQQSGATKTCVKVRDAVTVTISGGITNLSVNVFSPIKVRDQSTLAINLISSSYDKIIVRDQPSVTLGGLFVNVNDPIKVKDQPSLLLNLVIPTSDKLIVRDQPTVNIGAISINVNDPIKVRDQGTALIANLPIPTSDRVITKDQPSLLIPNLPINVYDKVITKDSPQVSIGGLNINVYSAVKVRDSITPVINPLVISANDPIKVRDAIYPLIPYLPLPVSDKVIVRDQPSVLIPKLIVSVYEPVKVRDDSQLKLGQLKVDVNDSVKTRDFSTVSCGNITIPIISESCIVRDTNYIKLRQLKIEVNDPVIVRDSSSVLIKNLNISVNEPVKVKDSPYFNLTININVSDKIIARDTPSARLGILSVSVNDKCIVRDVPNIILGSLKINVSEPIIIRDSPSLRSNKLFISVNDNCKVRDEKLILFAGNIWIETYDSCKIRESINVIKIIWFDLTSPSGTWNDVTPPSSVWTDVPGTSGTWNDV